jgi:hypothetical protein
MNKFAVAVAAAGLMALAACGEKPAAEANNATNVVEVNEMGAANALDNAANATVNAAGDAMNGAANVATNVVNAM